MATRDVRSLVIEHFAAELRRRHCPDALAAAMALALIVEGQGIALVRPAHHHDPDADWRAAPRPERVTPARDAASGYRAARAALNHHTDTPDSATEEQ